MEQLKKQILKEVPRLDMNSFQWTEFNIRSEKFEEKNGYRVYTEALQSALDRYHCVKIPAAGETVYIDRPLIMKSGYRLWVDCEQRISNLPGDCHCMIRNANIENGFYHSVEHKDPDTEIAVIGGIWDGACQKGTGCRFEAGEGEVIEGAMSIMIFSNVEQLVVKDAQFYNGGSNYALQISNAKGFHVSGLTFIEYGRDGVHMNGPICYGEVCHLKGRDMGDDMVALNAWDWDVSAITFGTVEYLYVHDNESRNNELRLLPGRKMYEDHHVDCDIRKCILEGLSGIYTFKMYCQPNIRNAYDKSSHDVSGTVGNIYEVYFKNITVNEKKAAGFASLPVKSIFEVCADCHDIYFEDIRIAFAKNEFDKQDMCLMNVGPLSATWTRHSDDPQDWGEVFDPDAVCRIEDFYFKNVSFTDCQVEDAAELVREVHMTVNPDYPRTTPRGGNGYGVVGKIHTV